MLELAWGWRRTNYNFQMVKKELALGRRSYTVMLKGCCQGDKVTEIGFGE